MQSTNKDNRNIVAICGSMKVIDLMLKVSDELKSQGWFVYLPTLDEPIDYQKLSPQERPTVKSRLIMAHIKKIKKAECILVLNQSIDNRQNYIGANSFLEMGFAFALGKKIYLLNDIPNQSNKDELDGMLPIVIRGDLSLLGT